MGETQGIELGIELGIESLGMTVTFEACTEFRPGHHDLLVCSCGWLEHDHVIETLAVVRPVRRRGPQITLPERRAS
jgi:hypothetical protein